MDERLEKILVRVVEDKGWGFKFNKEESYLLLSNSSPEGEDISIEINFENGFDIDYLFEEIESTYNDFDCQDHAVMWYETHGSNGAPTDLEVLMKDAKDIENMYGDLLAVIELIMEKEKGKLELSDIKELINEHDYKYEYERYGSEELDNDIAHALVYEYGLTEDIAVAIINRAKNLFDPDEDDLIDQCASDGEFARECIDMYLEEREG